MNCGGAENMIMNLYRNLNQKDIQFDFLCCTNDFKTADYDQEIELLGGHIYKIALPSIFKIFNHIKDLKKVICENGPYDAIHIHTLLHAGIQLPHLVFICLISIVGIFIPYFFNVS